MVQTVLMYHHYCTLKRCNYLQLRVGLADPTAPVTSKRYNILPFFLSVCVCVAESGLESLEHQGPALYTSYAGGTMKPI